MKSGEHYFAFISYSRKDYDIARAIWRRLESFRYPSRVEQRYRPKNSKYVREIFFDRTKLECSNESFKKGISEALSQSRYLIVICSPQYTESKWCLQELTRFRELHDNKNTNIMSLLKSIF